MVRRILDYFGLAHYDPHPRIPRRADLSIGVNVHADGSAFGDIAYSGFDTVLVDWLPEMDQDEFEYLLATAQKFYKLKTFVTGLPKDGDITEHARELLSRHGSRIDYLAVRNEPDLAKFYGGNIHELAEDVLRVWAEREVRAKHVKIVAPCVSSLGSSSRLGVENVIRELGRLKVWQFVDVIGQHIYRDTPDAVLRYYRHIRKVYRDAGWTQKFFISEFGWRSRTEHWGGSGGGGPFTVDREERQAKYVANTMAMLAAEPDVCGIGVYVCNDDVAAKDFFGIRGKKAWQRITDGLK